MVQQQVQQRLTVNMMEAGSIQTRENVLFSFPCSAKKTEVSVEFSHSKCLEFFAYPAICGIQREAEIKTFLSNHSISENRKIRRLRDVIVHR